MSREKDVKKLDKAITVLAKYGKRRVASLVASVADEIENGYEDEQG